MAFLGLALRLSTPQPANAAAPPEGPTVGSLVFSYPISSQYVALIFEDF